MYKTINLKINTTSTDTKYEAFIELLFDNSEYVDHNHRVGAARKMDSYTFR